MTAISGCEINHHHTDLETCCSSNEGPYCGHWFAPGSIESLSHDSNSYHESYSAQRVDMRRRKNGDMPTGTYYCEIITNGNRMERHSVHIMIYRIMLW